jgi:ABC-type Fe3+ transport system permease subunit
MYLHGMAAWQVTLLLSLYQEQLQGGQWADLVVVGLVQGVRLASLVFLITLGGWHSLDARWLEPGLLVGSRQFVRWRLVLPLLAPFIAFGALLAIMISVTDVSIPLLFQVHSVVSLQLWDAHYRQFDPPTTWRAMLAPAVLLVGAAGLLMPLLWRRAGPLLTARRDPAAIPRPAISRALLTFAGVAVLALMNGSMIHLLRQITSLQAIAVTFDANRREIMATIENSLGAAAVALIAGAALAPFVAASRRWSVLLLTLATALFAVPGFLWAAASVSWWSQPGLRGAVYDIGVVRWLALGTRLLVIPALIVGLALARQSRTQREAATLAPLTPWQTWWGVTWPPLRRGVWVAYALAVIFVVGDLDAAVLLDLPGKTTLIVALCNRLHITPRSPEVALMALVMLTTTLAMLAAPFVASLAWRRVRRAL